VSKLEALICDGCGKTIEWKGLRNGRPRDWRALHVTDANGASRRFDVCSAYCASKAVDKTYEREDGEVAERAGLTVVR
jgi:hypothetical protein